MSILAQKSKLTLLTSVFILTWIFGQKIYIWNNVIWHTIRKVQNFNFDKTPTFHEFLNPIFFDNFSCEINVVNSQKVQNQSIFTSFSPKKKNRQFSREIKVEFLDEKWRFRIVCSSVTNLRFPVASVQVAKAIEHQCRNFFSFFRNFLNLRSKWDSR